MKIKSTMVYMGKSYDLIYQDADDFSHLPKERCLQVYGVCFYEGKIVLGFSRRMQKWNLIGGTVEAGESLEEALKREIKEESNMKVLKLWPIGYQRDINSSNYQLRYACLVKPFGPFRGDPDAGDTYGVDKIILIDPKDYKKYIDWDKIGDRLFERAITIAGL